MLPIAFDEAKKKVKQEATAVFEKWVTVFAPCYLEALYSLQITIETRDGSDAKFQIPHLLNALLNGICLRMKLSLGSFGNHPRAVAKISFIFDLQITYCVTRHQSAFNFYSL